MCVHVRSGFGLCCSSSRCHDSEMCHQVRAVPHAARHVPPPLPPPLLPTPQPSNDISHPRHQRHACTAVPCKGGTCHTRQRCPATAAPCVSHSHRHTASADQDPARSAVWQRWRSCSGSLAVHCPSEGPHRRQQGVTAIAPAYGGRLPVGASPHASASCCLHMMPCLAGVQQLCSTWPSTHQACQWQDYCKCAYAPLALLAPAPSGPGSAATPHKCGKARSATPHPQKILIT